MPMISYNRARSNCKPIHIVTIDTWSKHIHRVVNPYFRYKNWYNDGDWGGITVHTYNASSDSTCFKQYSFFFLWRSVTSLMGHCHSLHTQEPTKQASSLVKPCFLQIYLEFANIWHMTLFNLHAVRKIVPCY